MKPEEAIKMLNRYIDNEAYTDHFQDVCRTAIEALEKQIPKQPIIHGYRDGRLINTLSYTCQSCGEYIGAENYCKHCVQAIDDIALFF